MFNQFLKKAKIKYSALPFVIHPLFLVLGVYCFWAGIMEMFLCYTLSALLHEGGHYLVAKRCGYKMIQLKLMPYGAELSGELDQFIYNDEIKIALAGPLTSLCISIVVVMLWWLSPGCYVYTYDFCMSNLVCAIFNCLPIYPLDGGRVLVASLSKRIRRIDAINYSKIATRVFSICLFVLFILSSFYTFNLSFGIIAIMLFVSSMTTASANNYYRVSSRLERRRNSAKGLEVVELMVGEDVKIYKVYAKLKSQKFYRFLVVDKDMKVCAVLDEGILDGISPEDFKKTFGELSKIKSIKSCFAR